MKDSAQSYAQKCWQRDSLTHERNKQRLIEHKATLQKGVSHNLAVLLSEIIERIEQEQSSLEKKYPGKLSEIKEASRTYYSYGN